MVDRIIIMNEKIKEILEGILLAGYIMGKSGIELKNEVVDESVEKIIKLLEDQNE